MLSDYLDGEVEAACAFEIEQHLSQCAACRTLHAELCQLVEAGQMLIPQMGGPSLTTHKVPPQKLATATVSSWSETWVHSFLNRYVEIRLTMPQFLAAVGLSLGIVTAIGWTLVQNSYQPGSVLSHMTSVSKDTGSQAKMVAFDPPAAPAQVERAVLIESIGRLTKSLDRRKMNWNPQIRRVFERNMAIIDQSLEECAAVLQENPHDAETEEMLLAAYREKLRLLQEFAAL
ncbi:MAG: zf-HC2 domain-containing protein [Blastocatellia bacterium]|nr:zf-HC2 domain-containing protein [Blastocatellia bacterium]